MEAELRKQPTANEGTCNPYEEVTDDPEPGTLRDLTGQPSGNETDHQNDQQTITRYMHLRILSIYQKGYDHIGEETVQNCSTQEVCRYIEDFGCCASG